MDKGIINILGESYKDWKFVSINPNIHSDIVDYAEPIDTSSNSNQQTTIRIGKQYDLVFFIDGSRYSHIVASAESSNPDRRRYSYPIAVGQTSVVACSLNRKTGLFKAEQKKHKIIVALPNDIEKNRKRLPVKVKEVCFSGNTEVLIVPYDSKVSPKGGKTLFDISRNAIHNCMREDEGLILNNLLNSIDKEQNPLIIIDGKFQGEVPVDSPVLSINKQYDYTALEDKLRKEINNIKDYKQVKSYPTLVKDKKSVWYIRLRDNEKDYSNSLEPLEMNAGIVECALMGDYRKHRKQGLIICECTKLVRDLASPTCYGLDYRWRTHLYHMYLTEVACKQQYINETYLMKIIYG